MHQNPDKIAILLNGPPRAGKDTGSVALCLQVEGAEILKFTAPVKDLTHRNLGLDCRHDAYEALKDTPLPEFGGRTPRQAYIDTSRKLRQERGEDAVAHLFVEAMAESEAAVIVNPDVGYDFEGQAVADELGCENVLLLRIHREGHDFSSDCRDWVSIDGVETHDVENEEGCQRKFVIEVVELAHAFLARRRPAALRRAG